MIKLKVSGALQIAYSHIPLRDRRDNCLTFTGFINLLTYTSGNKNKSNVFIIYIPIQ